MLPKKQKKAILSKNIEKYRKPLLGVYMLSYPFSVNHLDFVRHFTDEDKEEAAKILNRNFKRFLKTSFKEDILSEISLYLIGGDVKIGKGSRQKNGSFTTRPVRPGDLTNFLNKVIPRLYFQNYRSKSQPISTSSLSPVTKTAKPPRSKRQPIDTPEYTVRCKKEDKAVAGRTWISGEELALGDDEVVTAYYTNEDKRVNIVYIKNIMRSCLTMRQQELLKKKFAYGETIETIADKEKLKKHEVKIEISTAMKRLKDVLGA